MADLFQALEFEVITSVVSELLGRSFLSYKCNDRKVLLPNFKAVGQTQVELQLTHVLKVEQLDAPLFPFLSRLMVVSYA